jgi:hypothetical protein
MNETVQISVLQFEGEPEFRILPAYSTKFRNHLQAMVEIAHVVVGHFKNNELLGNHF